MSPSAFEAHCGAGSNRKWRFSLRHADEGCPMGHWLEARGLISPATRGGGSGSSRPGKTHAASPGQQDSWIDSLEAAQLFPEQPYRVPLPHSQAADPAMMEDPSQRSGLTSFDATEPTEAQPRDRPTQVDVVCRGTTGVLDLITWKVRSATRELCWLRTRLPTLISMIYSYTVCLFSGSLRLSGMWHWWSADECLGL